VLGDVEPLADGTIRVGGSDPTRWYHLVGLTCTCTDFTQEKAPLDATSGQRWCKHRIAAGIDRRVREVLAAEASRTPPPPAPVPPGGRILMAGLHLPADCADAVYPAAPAPVPGHAQTPTPAPLPEAPASVNVRLTIGGREVQLTLRGTDEAEVLTRLEAVLARYPQPQPPAPAPSRQAPAPEIGWCHTHGVEMTLNTKDGRQWWSHYDATAGRWCKGR